MALDVIKPILNKGCAHGFSEKVDPGRNGL